MPPMKINDVPTSNPDQDRNYRSYKLQFQAPNNVGLFTWKMYLVSDSFVGEEICVDIAVRLSPIPKFYILFLQLDSSKLTISQHLTPMSKVQRTRFPIQRKILLRGRWQLCGVGR